MNPIFGGESRFAWDSVHLWSGQLRPKVGSFDKAGHL